MGAIVILIRNNIGHLFYIAFFLKFLQIIFVLDSFADPVTTTSIPIVTQENKPLLSDKTGSELKAEGLRFYYQKDYKKALELWLKGLGMDPHNASLANNIGLAYRRCKEYSEAIKYHQKAIELNPKYGHAYNSLGLTYYEMGDYQNAIQAYSKALELGYNPKTMYFNLGLTYYDFQQYDQAVYMLLKALDLKYDPEACYVMLGFAYYGLREYEKGIEVFYKLAKIRPDSSEVRYYLGNGYRALGRFYQARREYKRGLTSGHFYKRDELEKAIKEIDQIGFQYKFVNILFQIWNVFFCIVTPVVVISFLGKREWLYKLDKQKIFMFIAFWLFLPLPTYGFTNFLLVPPIYSLKICLDLSLPGWKEFIRSFSPYFHYVVLMIFNYSLVCMFHKIVKSKNVLWIMIGILTAASLFDIYYIQDIKGLLAPVNILALLEKIFLAF